MCGLPTRTPATMGLRPISIPPGRAHTDQQPEWPLHPPPMTIMEGSKPERSRVGRRLGRWKRSRQHSSVPAARMNRPLSEGESYGPPEPPMLREPRFSRFPQVPRETRPRVPAAREAGGPLIGPNASPTGAWLAALT